MADHKNNEQQSQAKDFLIGALVGGIIGSLTALLLAPKSGKELRQDLVDQTKNMKEKTDYLKEVAIQRGSEWASVAKEKTSQWTKVVQEQSNSFMNKSQSNADVVKKEEENEYEETHI